MPDSLLPVIEQENVILYHGDAVIVLPLLEAGSADSVVTDPPYGLGFADQGWDEATGFRESLTGVDTVGMTAGEVFQAWCAAWAAGALHVLKPGGYLAAFGGTRTWHRMVAGVEAAGFEVRDQIAWLYSSGMPKSMDVSAAIDKHFGLVRPDREVVVSDSEGVLGATREVVSKGEPISEAAKRMQGVGTALKPGFEPILIARKPFDGTLVSNVLEFGTGGLNIDAARVDERWPANVALDGGQATRLDAAGAALSDAGVSSRFPVFRYSPKAQSSERPHAFGVAHATVKPLSLMRWLVTLVTPPTGTVLEPFAGSGSTIEAALDGGFTVIAVEKEESFIPLIQSRLEHRTDKRRG